MDTPAKRSPGRPRKAQTAEKLKGKNIPLRESERALIAWAAELDGMPSTTWCRQVILQAARLRVGSEKVNESARLKDSGK